MSDAQRINVASELSQLQRIGALSVTTNAVERTIVGEFDALIAEAGGVREATDAICDLLRLEAAK